jgi:CheY-like chemotaxis protein
MLLYDNNSERDVATVSYINQGLEENQLCMYASVYAYDEPRLSRILHKIKDYKENINKRNLLIVNLKPFYDSALNGDLIHFEKLKTQTQQELERRNNKSVIIVADCADNLFQNQYFDQSELVESWWHRVYLEWIQQEEKKKNNRLQNNITIICPHLGKLLGKHPFSQHKNKIFDNHSITMDIEGRILNEPSTSVKRRRKQEQRLQQFQPTEPSNPTIESQTHILVAEPEPDHQYIYSMWLHSQGFKNILVTDSGRKCLEKLVDIESKTRSNVIFILDSHLRDISFVELAKEISNCKPDTQIILTTTLSLDTISSMAVDIINNNSRVLLKPFELPDLLALIGNSN